ncbi:peroxide stress protein YaaA [Aeromicrobium phragmitis]|uniref:Peroxide stress protein YaaA n=1 Tax=Aeromicrobium phragmitis TaxID=2478914 RepID=A0A3L8PL80_9ACTN|nr:peroxide stress protein YaaA [Aeromicrobium phragmitis]RLV56000.1 peroxide stress protein YaaA [Aeromicrobium phragmitis]
MLILLPPSEGKTRPEQGPALDLATLSLPELNPTREQLLRTLIRVSAGSPRRAMEVLGLGPTQADALPRNASLREEPTARADAVYTGVLFDNLDPGSFDEAVRDRADSTVAIASALFGLVRPSDHIPAYRLSGSVTLPRLGTVASRWKPHLPGAIERLADGRLVVDLRSGTYVNLGAPPRDVPGATMRVLHEKDGKRSVVSHFNKATKGRVARQLLAEEVNASTPDDLADALRDLGWTVEVEKNRLDLIVSEL